MPLTEPKSQLASIPHSWTMQQLEQESQIRGESEWSPEEQHISRQDLLLLREFLAAAFHGLLCMSLGRISARII